MSCVSICISPCASFSTGAVVIIASGNKSSSVRVTDARILLRLIASPIRRPCGARSGVDLIGLAPESSAGCDDPRRTLSLFNKYNVRCRCTFKGMAKNSEIVILMVRVIRGLRYEICLCKGGRSELE